MRNNVLPRAFRRGSVTLVAMALVGASTGVLGGATAVAENSAAPDPIQPTDVDPDLAAAVTGQMLAGATTMSAELGFTPSAQDVLVEGQRATADRSWVFGGSVVRLPSDVDGSPRAMLFLGHRENGTWRVALEGSQEFASLVRQAPDAVVPDPERPVLAKTADPAPMDAPLGLSLPWKLGDSWGSAGVHGDSGSSRPYNAIDFHGGDSRVLAARAGKIYRFCTRGTRWHFLKVYHDNGWTTGYYHTRYQTSKGNGAHVAAGEFLGQTGNELPCGGRSSGAHVHFTLWQGDRAVGVHGKTIGGWTFYEGSRPYSGYAVHEGRRVNFPASNGSLRNYGPGNTTATGTVRNDGGWVNLRSGPGTSYDKVGALRDGTVVEIACTARGEELTGPWNNKSDIWDRLPDGKWISDAFVDTGTNEPVAPSCA
ncbi:hypothetical protein GCM10012275_21540 [Longimycelium tulufanense]|uniref:SH3b domain-containing protein n=1 Tax=Longimycelium tulufanense TaxID=907463 RepID=A0A8J3CEV9_9PSEU|nr:M23 family metallopeptidase [Longimycelium tulufanense]GGM50354.1 hypothetical protein GCM10012275_21540 [Longimycelium tulufanense]